MDFIVELFYFLKYRKKYWMIPLICTLLALSLLMIATGISALSPLIYSVF
ncbi:DUF5989 family protein [Galbibacter pacificus]|uniref:DUF5989 family protein n=1 Tax=Galbibacter pacificus TaxID=2996052 RepID=A0ABT6FN80_9FLAO|nr:DUF5989 family protein [Galbibacter pacificus]MDG3581063.1 DUF5989 family protein [Galbibacter pacificus]MDG3584541.1 DUF5989 family protein [Galbibacter pacificus]